MYRPREGPNGALARVLSRGAARCGEQEASGRERETVPCREDFTSLSSSESPSQLAQEFFKDGGPSATPMHALGPIRALRPRLQRLTASLVKRRTPIAAEPRDPPRDIALRPSHVFLSRQIPTAVARSRPRAHLVAMAVPPSPKRVNGDKSPKASKAKAKAPRRTSPTEDIEDLIGKHPSLASIRDDAPRLRDELLAWYDKSHRILPWRRNFHSQHAPPPPGPRGDGAEPREYWAGCDTAGAPANVGNWKRTTMYYHVLRSTSTR